METTAQPQAAARARGRLRRVLARVALTAALLLLAAYLGISAIAANTLTVPRRVFGSETPAAHSVAYQDVRFPSADDGLSIAGWYMPREGSRKAVVLVHGWNGSRTSEFKGDFVDFGAALQRRGFAVLMIDMRGHGQSDDSHFSFGIAERRDVEGAIEWLKAQGFEPGSIGALGVSMGGATTIGATFENADIGALVADCSFADVYPLIESKWTTQTPLPQIFLPSTLLMARLLFGYDLSASRPVDEIAHIAPRPVLIIHGTDDAFTPLDHAHQLKAAAPSAEYWEVPGAAHGGSYQADPAAYVERVAAFFERSLE